MPRHCLAPAAIAGGLALGLAAAASADVITQPVSFDWTGGPAPTLTFAPFDDAGGTRQLTGVSVGFAGDASVDMEFGNNGENPVEGGTWSAEVTYSPVLNFLGDGPLVGLGGVFADGITGDLGAGTGSPFDPPGSPTVLTTVSGTVDFLATLGLGSFDYFTADVPELSASIGSFTDVLVTPPPGGGAIISAVSLAESQVGTVTLMYDFTVVPGPGAAAMLGLAGLAGLGRRRRH